MRSSSTTRTRTDRVPVDRRTSVDGTRDTYPAYTAIRRRPDSQLLVRLPTAVAHNAAPDGSAELAQVARLLEPPVGDALEELLGAPRERPSDEEDHPIALVRGDPPQLC